MQKAATRPTFRGPRTWIVVGALLVGVSHFLPSDATFVVELCAVALILFSVGRLAIDGAAGRKGQVAAARNRKKGFLHSFLNGVLWALFPAWKMGKGGAEGTGREVSEDVAVTSAALRFQRKAKDDDPTVERFAEALERLGLRERQLPAIERSWKRRALTYAAVTDVFLIVGLGCAIGGSWRGALVSLLGMAIFYVLAVTTHFRLAEIRRREFFPFLQFIRAGGWLSAINCLDW